MEQIHRLMTKIPTDLDEALCQFIRQMLFAMRRIGEYRDMEFLSSYPILLCRKERIVLIQLLKKPSCKCRRKLTGYERLSRAVYRFFACLKISSYQLHQGSPNFSELRATSWYRFMRRATSLTHTLLK